jgi:hypothetical protein
LGNNVDVICGPDAYWDLLSLLAKDGGEGGNVMLSVDKTYTDIMPVPLIGRELLFVLVLLRVKSLHESYGAEW